MTLNFYCSILNVSAIVLANLCVSYIMTTQNEEAEELMRKIEKEEETLAYEDPDKKVFHLCIVNLVIGKIKKILVFLIAEKNRKTRLSFLTMAFKFTFRDPAFSYLFLCLLKAFVFIIETVSDLLTGLTLTRGSYKERLKAEVEGRSAHVVNVIWRAWFKETERHDLSNFLFTHAAFEKADYVLGKNHVTLYSVFAKFAVFCETEPEVDLYDTKRFPFMWISQFLHVQKLIILPIEAFHRLAEEKVGDPKVPVLGINMTAR